MKVFALACGVVAASCATAGPSAEAQLTELSDLDAAGVTQLLEHWGHRSILTACKKRGGCTGSDLENIAGSIAESELDEVAAEILKDTNGLDLLGFTQNMATVTADGGVSPHLVTPRRRQLAASSDSGLWIKRDASSITLGERGDVSLSRTGPLELTVDNSVVVDGNLTANGWVDLDSTLNVAGDVYMSSGATIAGHLEVDKTISTGYGRITRDFHQFFTTTSGAYYYEMKTSIKAQGAIMFRLEILGYAYGASDNIDSVTTGYTYSGWDCVSNEDNVDFGYGNIGVYCSSDGYVVLEYYCPSTYFLGLTVSGWFLNPTGTAHDIEVLDAAFVSTQGYFAGRRRLDEDGNPEPKFPPDHNKLDAAPAIPIIADRLASGGNRRSYAALADEVKELRETASTVAELQAELKELRQRVETVEARS